MGLPRMEPSKQGLLKEWGGLLAGVAGVLTAAGALLKSCDHSVTQSAYDTLGVSIAKLADQQQRDHNDLANLRGYIDGMARTPPALRAASQLSDVVGGSAPALAPLAPLDRSALRRPVPPLPEPAEAPPVPTVSPAPRLIRAPDFASIR